MKFDINSLFGSLLALLPIANAVYAVYGHGRWKTALTAQAEQQRQINTIALAVLPPLQQPTKPVFVAPLTPDPRPAVLVPDPVGTVYIKQSDGTLVRQ